MEKKKKTKIVLSVLMMVVLLMGMMPGVAMAATDPTLSWFDFMSSSDSTLITGETVNINVKMYQDYSLTPYSGGATATITDAGGNQTNYSISGSQGSQGMYTVNNVTIDTPGAYTLNVFATSPSTGSYSRTINVINAVTAVTGTFAINANDLMTVKLTDTNGNPLPRRSVTVDGSAIGAMAQTYTTLSDGTFTFQMTPSSYGNATITHAGHIIGTIPVVPSYTQSPRIGGATNDNVSLSVAVAKNGWPNGARNVILARDDDFADAMSAVPLSKMIDAPILMTDSQKLDDRTLTEIQNIGAVNIYIVGGTPAISQSIEDQLKEHYMVNRIAGSQRYDTAVEVSKYVGIDASHTVYIANGYAIPDAIAASAFAAEQGSPILLTDKDEVPASTMQALANLNVSQIVLLGGPAVISSKVESELSAKYLVKRWGGNDRYDTQNIIFQNLFNNGKIPQSPLYFANSLVRQDDVNSGKPFADALLTAALAAKNGGFVAMLPPDNLPSSLNYFLLFNKGYISKAAVVGNSQGISSNLEQQLQQLLNR